MVAVCSPKKLFLGGGALALVLLFKLDVCAGIWKLEALFAKIGAWEEVPLNVLNRFWISYSSGTKGGCSSLMLGIGGEALVRLQVLEEINFHCLQCLGEINSLHHCCYYCHYYCCCFFYLGFLCLLIYQDASLFRILFQVY